MVSFADKPTLRGRRVTVRPLALRDADDLLALLEDADTRRLTGTHDVFTLDQVEQWCRSRSAQTDRLDLAIESAAGGAFLGECALTDWHEVHRTCNLRIALAPSWAGKGFGRDALRLVIDYVFANLPIDRIGLDVYAHNARALHVFHALGFAPEGRLHGPNGHDDVLILGLLRFEWEHGGGRRPAGAC